jgi:hypothetical protein
MGSLNRARDAGEPGPAGWTIFLDADADGQLDAGELSTSTDANGAYAFTNIAPGTYHVAEVTLSHWVLTTPSANRIVTLPPGQSATAASLAPTRGLLRAA